MSSDILLPSFPLTHDAALELSKRGSLWSRGEVASAISCFKCGLQGYESLHARPAQQLRDWLSSPWPPGLEPTTGSHVPGVPHPKTTPGVVPPHNTRPGSSRTVENGSTGLRKDPAQPQQPSAASAASSPGGRRESRSESEPGLESDPGARAGVSQGLESLLGYAAAVTALNERAIQADVEAARQRERVKDTMEAEAELSKAVDALHGLGATVYLPPNKASAASSDPDVLPDRNGVDRRGGVNSEEDTAGGVAVDGMRETSTTGTAGGGVGGLNPGFQFNWGELKGYSEVKKRVAESLVSVFMHADLYHRVAVSTRSLRGGAAVPRAVLFYGPPGTGKTLCARLIAENCQVALVYVPAEAFLSKFFGESEKNLSAIFRNSRKLGKQIVLFLDEIDSVLVSRDGGDGSGSHRTERRLLASFLRQLDGFESRAVASHITLIAATNRREDLDQALLSRFEIQIGFGVPTFADRCEIFGEYAQHLSSDDIVELARVSDGLSLSGRNIRDMCIQAERRFVHRLISNDCMDSPDALPALSDYLEVLHEMHV